MHKENVTFFILYYILIVWIVEKGNGERVDWRDHRKTERKNAKIS